MDETIGELLRRLRKAKGLSQRRLSEISGVDRAYICQLEADKAGSTTLKTAEKLASGLGVSPSVFFGEEVQLTKLEDDIIQVPVYDDFPVHAGAPTHPVEHIYLLGISPAKKSLEGYKVKGDCLSPEIQNGDTVVVDRDGDIESGNLVICLVEGDEVHLGRLRKIAGDYFLENKHRRFKLEECSVIAPVIQVNRRLK